jgi:enamine deaminase RidA (YjgF/YER057c/UK114 family)
VRRLQPPGWPPPRGYANGIEASGRFVFVGGQIGWDESGAFADGLPGQVGQALANIVAVLAEAGAGPEHVTRLTWFITDRESYLAQQKEIGAAYRAVMDRHFPAMSVVQVVALVEAEALVEIEATAVFAYFEGGSRSG